jgi:glycosyltransferase involved in cell wall biosynthesis
LAAAILDILKDADRWTLFSSSAKERARHEFSRASFSKKFEKIYAQVLDLPWKSTYCSSGC